MESAEAPLSRLTKISSTKSAASNRMVATAMEGTPAQGTEAIRVADLGTKVAAGRRDLPSGCIRIVVGRASAPSAEGTLCPSWRRRGLAPWEGRC